MLPDMQRWERRAWWAAACALVIVYLATAPRAWQCEGLDEVEYLALSHSLSAGLGYTVYGQPHVLYPPVYPLLLSLPWRMAGGPNWAAFYGLNALVGAAGLIWLGALLRRSPGSAGRWASWLLVTAYYPWSFSTRYLLSEPLFLLLSAALLAVVTRARAAPRVAGGTVLLAAALAALAAGTRFASVTLLAGVAFSLLLDGARRRLLPLALLGVVVGGVGLAGLAGWEIRAARVDPHARESYGKWVQALTGSGSAEARRLAARVGEGLEEKASWAQRAGMAGLKAGQYLLSAPRVNAHFAPLGLGLFGLFLWGLVGHLRRDPASPMAWYTAVTLLVITLTSWVSSYHRYLYPLSPFLFCFAVEGGHDLYGRRARPAVRLLLGLVALAGLGWWCTQGRPPNTGGAEGAYATTLAWGVAGVLLALLLLAARPSLRVPAVAAALLVAGLAVQNAGLLALRGRQTRADATPRARNLVGFRDCCAWVRAHRGPGDQLKANVPVVAWFLTGLSPAEPVAATGSTWMVLSGPLRDFPAYRPDLEAELRGAAINAHLPQAFSSGGAAVYRAGPP